MNEGIKPVYVFDGKPSPLKQRTISERRLLKEKAKINLEEAIQKGDVERIAALRRSINYITSDIVDECKTLLGYMGGRLLFSSLSARKCSVKESIMSISKGRCGENSM